MTLKQTATEIGDQCATARSRFTSWNRIGIDGLELFWTWADACRPKWDGEDYGRAWSNRAWYFLSHSAASGRDMLYREAGFAIALNWWATQRAPQRHHG